jgi:hypothetical protein
MIHAKNLAAALFAGILFGLGLSVAQMIDPAKVVNFLDIFGTWDPSLAFVMGGGLLVNAIATPLIMKRGSPVLAEFFRVPAKNQVDRRIVIGIVNRACRRLDTKRSRRRDGAESDIACIGCNLEVFSAVDQRRSHATCCCRERHRVTGATGRNNACCR